MAKKKGKVSRSRKVKKTTRKKGAKRKADDDVDGISLPTELSEPSDDLNDYFILVHGEKKIGKTTLALQDKSVFLMSFDPPQKALRAKQRHMDTWTKFTAYVRELRKVRNKFPYSRIIVDGCDIAYNRCQSKICADNGWSHPQDGAYGKGWDAVKGEFEKYIDMLMSLPCGVWFICHSRWREVENRDGEKFNKLVPFLKGAAEEIIAGKVDGWFAYDYVGKKRALIIRGDERTAAGHKMDEDAVHFRTTDGEPIEEIPLGSSAKEAYANLLTAFNNEQEVSRLPRPQKKSRKKKGGKKKSRKKN